MLAIDRLKRDHAPAAPSRLTETMTVNRILKECPATKQVFDKLLVSVPYEGCDCLDEVAWRHGLEAPDLVRTLDAAIAACACCRPQASGQAACFTASTTEKDMTAHAE